MSVLVLAFCDAVCCPAGLGQRDILIAAVPLEPNVECLISCHKALNRPECGLPTTSDQG
jgi:hypothetical protein